MLSSLSVTNHSLHRLGTIAINNKQTREQSVVVTSASVVSCDRGNLRRRDRMNYLQNIRDYNNNIVKIYKS